MTWNKERVLELRRKLGLTQSELATELGCRQQTISEWEQGLYEPANAYGRLLGQMDKQIALSQNFKIPEPKFIKKPVEVEVFTENSFDKPFDPAID